MSRAVPARLTADVPTNLAPAFQECLDAITLIPPPTCAALSFPAPPLDIADSPWLHTCYKAIHPDTGKSVEYKELLASSDGLLWEECCAEEIGRLAQGYKCIQGTNTIHFIKLSDIPADRRATYLRLVVADRPHKSNSRRVRFTVGGDKIDYPGDVSTKTSGLITAKLLLNSVVSTPDARFCAFDIKDFYLNTPMDRYEYMRIPVHQIPPDIFAQYELQELVHNNYVYVEIRKGMYGLPQAGILANNELVPHLAAAGYHQCTHTHGLFKHTTRPIMFALVVDDFGTGYSNLNYLNILPINKLKIDKSFIQDDSGKGHNIALSILALAKKLKLKVVAEGVETKEQLDFLKKNQCDEVQGYYFSKPIESEHFIVFVKENRILNEKHSNNNQVIA